MEFSKLMGSQTILPIVIADTAVQGVHIARAIEAAGLHLVEVVLRTPASLDALRAIKDEVPSLLVGAGTVLTDQSLDEAIKAGADFIVTPAVSPRFLTSLANCGRPVLPGVSGTSDVLMAYEHGFREMKLFPASLSGGVDFLRAIGSVFQDVVFCPTGGVNRENFEAYLSLDNVIAAGGTWMCQPDWVKTERWDLITSACR